MAFGLDLNRQKAAHDNFEKRSDAEVLLLMRGKPGVKEPLQALVELRKQSNKQGGSTGWDAPLMNRRLEEIRTGIDKHAGRGRGSRIPDDLILSLVEQLATPFTEGRDGKAE